MKNTNIEVEGGEILIQSKEGHYAIIPAKYRQEVMDMVKDGCDDCINEYIKTLPKDSDYAQDGSLLPNDEDPILTSIYNKYPAFRNMGNVVLKADRTFTRDQTQVGDIEFFDSDKLENNTIAYNNGFKVKNPNPNGFGIIYNPDNNNEQSIMLDMLHGMTKDKVYAKHREEFSNAFLNSKYGEDYKREWEQYNKETNGVNDGEQQFKDNWIDGNIRNLMFEGTDEDFEKARYWKDAKKEYLQDENINRTFGQLKNYLQVGQGYMLPEVTIIANKINN